MKFLHSMIRVKNINDSLKFYSDFLGLNVIEKKSLEDCDLYFLGEDESSCQIELTYNYDIPTDGYKNGNAFGHFAFAVDNMNLVCEKVKEFGYEFLWEPFELTLKNEKGEISKKLIAFIKDPDGNEIELIQE